MPTTFEFSGTSLTSAKRAASSISIPEREWLVQGILPKGEVVLFTGDGGLGKSLVMLQLMVAQATGTPWLGMPVQKGRSFGLFCEDDEAELHRRLADITAASFTNFEDLFPMRLWSPKGQDQALWLPPMAGRKGGNTEVFEAVLEYLKSFEPDLVVLDTIGQLFGGNENARAEVTPFVNGCAGRIASETGATVVLVGHPSKSASGEHGAGYSGSTAWSGAVRAHLFLTKPDQREGQEPSKERILTTRKSNYGASGDEIARLIWQEGAYVRVNDPLGDAPQMDRAAQNDSLFLLLLDKLTAQNRQVSDSQSAANFAPKVMADMPDAARVTKGDLKQAMLRLFNKGAITNEGYGPPSKRARRLIRGEPGPD